MKCTSYQANIIKANASHIGFLIIFKILYVTFKINFTDHKREFEFYLSLIPIYLDTEIFHNF